MKKLFTLASLLTLASLVLAACGGSAPKASDLLGDIKNRGYILISTDPNYAPQSSLNTEGARPADTKCPSDTLTTAEMQGFDVDVAIAVGDALGVETCFATPGWDTLTAGNWANKWDMSVGSMTITTDRQKVLDFSVPYYYTPAVVAVLADSGITSLDQLNGQAICAGVSTTYETWLNGGDLGLPATSIYAQPPTGITVVPLDTDQFCVDNLTSGRTDFVAYVTSGTVVDANIAAGKPVVKVGGTVFSEDLAAAYDKASSLPTDTLRAEVDKLFTAMHSDGRLSALSIKWFDGLDLTTAPK
ncbi:MAG: transporter substrate-binding domain-containing protein [Chloroflexi bacterium]|nr:transporter substrate-binding domain-containing protein [Chloroflexota bacterium]